MSENICKRRKTAWKQGDAIFLESAMLWSSLGPFRSNNLKVLLALWVLTVFWYYQNFRIKNPVNMIKAIIRKLLWTSKCLQSLSVFNEQLESYGLLYFATFSLKSISHTSASPETTKRLQIDYKETILRLQINSREIL